jgi:hypothetical protein
MWKRHVLFFFLFCLFVQCFSFLRILQAPQHFFSIPNHS